ncbi:MAG: LysR family transcriptional regulator [Pseudomonadota bacterium]
MRFKHLDLNLFIGLKVLLEEQSITRTARRLHLSQSAASGILARLREHFKDELLVMFGKTMVLTPFGASLLEPVNALLNQVQETAERRPAVLPKDARRQFKLIASDYMTTVLLGDVARQVHRLAPGVGFELVDPSAACMDMFERGEVDLLITIKDYCNKSLPSKPLLEEHYTCIVCNDNTLVGDQLTLEQYLSMGHVTSQFGTDFRDSHENAFMKAQGYQRTIEMAASNFNSVPHFIMGTDRIATVHSRLARSFARYFPVRLVELPVPIPPIQVCMQWHEFMDHDPLHLWLRKLIEELAQIRTDERAGTVRGTAEQGGWQDSVPAPLH